MAVEYRPEGKRDIGRPKTRWTDHSMFKIEFLEDRTRSPPSVYVRDGGGGDDDDDDDDLLSDVRPRFADYTTAVLMDSTAVPGLHSNRCLEESFGNALLSSGLSC
jgi:hypothetical protein